MADSITVPFSNANHAKIGATSWFAGSVGIGTNSPIAKLDVTVVTPSVTTFSPYMQLSQRGTVANSKTGISFRNTEYNWDMGKIATERQGSSNSFDMVFYSTNTGTDGEGMRIDHLGNVGIGQAAPSTKLHINSGNATATTEYDLTIQSGNDATNMRHGIVFKGSDSNHEALIRTGNYGAYRSNLEFWVSNQSSAGSTLTQALSLLSAGDVRLNEYGSGTFTGTAAYNLQVDSTGKIIETAAAASSTVGGSGVANEVAVWSNASNVSGSGALTWNGDLLFIDGVMEAREKSFNIKHPTKEDKRLIYGVLEGPEHGVYCRGKVEGKVIELPEEWTGLVDEDTITVQLTSMGSHQNLYVKDIKDNKIFISNGNLLSSSIKAFYFVQAMRKDVKPLVTERDA